MTFHVGQKVVCVNDTWLHENWKYVPNRPRRGRLYTVRGIQNLPDDETRLLTAELVNPPRDWIGGPPCTEIGFEKERFRPVVERKTDISIFQRMLTDRTLEVTQ